ncbi:hypothetical protein UNH65_18070 [Chitinophaga sp. 180180018-2]|nr:hypothetical protein [Chitinophaga sp. 212800010-3]
MFLLCIVLFSCVRSVDPELCDVINDFSRNSIYLRLKLNCHGKQGIYLVRNIDCYLYLHSHLDIDKEEYKKLMLRQLTSEKALDIRGSYDSESPFILVSGSLDDLPIDTLFNRYFVRRNKYLILNSDGITNNLKWDIIAILFKKNVYCRDDDETGNLTIIE